MNLKLVKLVLNPVILSLVLTLIKNIPVVLKNVFQMIVLTGKKIEFAPAGVDVAVTDPLPLATTHNDNGIHKEIKSVHRYVDQCMDFKENSNSYQVL